MKNYEKMVMVILAEVFSYSLIINNLHYHSCNNDQSHIDNILSITTMSISMKPRLTEQLTYVVDRQEELAFRT